MEANKYKKKAFDRSARRRRITSHPTTWWRCAHFLHGQSLQDTAVMAACRVLMSRGVLALHYHNVCRGVMLTQIREKKRWMKAYTLIMERKRKIEGPPPPKPRSVQIVKATRDIHSLCPDSRDRMKRNNSNCKIQVLLCLLFQIIGTL